MTEAQANRIIELLTDIRDELKTDPVSILGDEERDWDFLGSGPVTISYGPAKRRHGNTE